MSSYPYPVPSWVTDDTTLHEYTSYGYQPNIPAAGVAAALYFILAIVHTALTARYAPRVWWMYIPTVTGVAEGLGYVFRILSVTGAWGCGKAPEVRESRRRPAANIDRLRRGS
jgi:hypothetical protein